MTVRIVQLDGPTLHALAAGDLVRARSSSPVPLSAWLVSPEAIGTWRMRARQADESPQDLPWVTGVVWDDATRTCVGKAGFHAAPDADGMVEVGYAIDPAYRRRGYARAALEAMLGRAADDPAVRTVRASVSPDNTASLALITGYGFVQVGEQWDDEDGLELVYEREAAT